MKTSQLTKAYPAFTKHKNHYISQSAMIFIFSLLMLINTFSAHANENENYELALESFYGKQYEESVIHLKNVIKEQAQHLPARLLLAKNYLALGKGALAESEIQLLIKANADKNRTTPLLAESYLYQGKNEEILNIITPVNATNTIKSELMAYRGLAYLNENKLVLAENEFNDALNLKADSSLAILGKAKIAIKNKDWQAALAQTSLVLQNTPQDTQALFMAAIIHQLDNNNEQALKVISKLLEIEPNHYTGLITRAMINISLGKLEQANKDIQQVSVKFPHEPITQFTATISSNEHETAIDLTSLIDSISEEIKEKQPVYYLLSSLASIKQKAFTKAESTLATYRRLVPEDVAAIKLLARVRIALENPFTAKKDLFEAKTLAPLDTEVWYLLAQVSLLTNETEKAKYYFQEVLKVESEHFESTLNLAKIYLVNGERDIAIALLQPIDTANLNTEVQTEVLLILAKAYQAKNQLNNALEYTSLLIKHQNNNSYAHQLHGTLLGLSGKIKEAHHSYLISHQLDENNFQVVIKLARLEAALGKTSLAIQRLTDNNERQANSAVMSELADIYQKSNREDLALLWYQKALSHNPSSILALTQIIQIQLRNQELDQAITLVNNFIDTNSKNADAYALAAQLYLQAGNSVKALEFMNRAVKWASNKAPQLVQLAQLQLKINQRIDSKLSLEKALAWQPSYAPAYLLLIALETEEKQEVSALAYIAKFEQNIKVASTETDTLILNLKGKLYWALNNPKKAEKFFTESLREAPTQDAIMGLFRIYRSKKQYGNISSLLENWLLDNPNDIQLTIALGENYRQNNELLKAKAFYKHLLDMNPNNVLLLNNSAIIHKINGELDIALALANKAYALAPKNVNIIDTKATILIALQKYNEALALLRQANILDYDNAEVKYHLAITLNKLNRKKEALVHLREAVESKQSFDEKELAKDLLAKWQKMH